MPRKCTICEHSLVEEINQQLVKGKSFHKISQNFVISYHALYRHGQEHIPRN